MQIVIEGIEPIELFKLMEGFIKMSDIQFKNKDELIQKWDKYKVEVIEKGKKVRVI